MAMFNSFCMFTRGYFKTTTLPGETPRYVEHLPELVSKGQVTMEEVDEGHDAGVFSAVFCLVDVDFIV